MKICFIGLGSIGTRHLRNLVQILSERNIDFEIHALRTIQHSLSKDLAEVIVKEVSSYDSLDDDYDIMFITNPTSKHYETLQNVLQKTKHVFIEKPLFMNLDKDLSSLSLKDDSIYYVAAPLRYNGVFPVVKEFVENHVISSIRAICSSYLPDWRKGCDYRENYSAHKDMGGGVSLDLIHEWDYLKYLFGMPKTLSYICGTKSDLEIDSDDIAVYIAEYEGMVLELHLDYFGRRSTRYVELFCREGTLKADFIRQTVTFDNGVDIVEYPVSKSHDPYVSEMNYFIDLCTGRITENQNSIYHAFATMKLALGELS